MTGLGAVLTILLLLVTLLPVANVWLNSLRDHRGTPLVQFEDARLQLENDVQTLQAAQRGYLISQQTLYLERYQQVSTELVGKLEQLRARAEGIDPDLVAHTDELQQRIMRWKAAGPDQQLALILDGDLAAAVADVSSGESQQRFDAVLEQLRLMRAETEQRNASVAGQIRSVQRLETLLAFCLGTLGIASGAYLVRVFRGLARLAAGIEQERERTAEAALLAETATAEAQRQLSDMHRRNQQLRVLNRVAGMTGAPLQARVRAERLLVELTESLNLSCGGVWQLRQEGSYMQLIAAEGSPSQPHLSLTEDDLVTTAVITDQPWVVSDVAEHELSGPTAELTAATASRSLVALPLRGRSGPVGAILLGGAAAGQFQAADLDYYVALAGQAGLILENAELYETVAQEQQRLRAIFDQSPEGILFVEAESGAVILANRAAHELLEHNLELNRPLMSGSQQLYLPNGDQLRKDQSPLEAALAGESRIGIEIVAEHRSGLRVPLLFNCVPLHGAAGEVHGAVAVFQNLTHFREVERLKSDFVAMVSHELRTPLTAIQGCTQALLHGPTSLDLQRTQGFLEIIEAQSGRLHELIDNLLDLSQMEAGVLRLRTAPMQPTRLVRSIVRQASERLRDVRVQADLPGPLPTISADADRVEQVLLNLLDNARKFSPPGGVITISAEAANNAIVFGVRDEGPGIPPFDRERVFERFYQGAPPPAGMVRGTGLGLAICKVLVEAHGGTIWVDERVSVGTRIMFTLPRVLDLQTSDVTLAPLSVPLRPAHDVAHLLVVDDDPAVRQMLAGSLRNAGYVASAVAEGQAALEHLASEQPDLVVLDLTLPGLDGLSILHQIRDWSTVLVLMLTASQDPQDAIRCLQAGADDFMTKPFNMEELLARVDALLRRSAERESEMPAVVVSGGLRVDMARHSVAVDGRAVDLTPTEFRLLAYLAQHSGKVLSHEQILQQVWGPAYSGESQYVWVHIGRLRQKIEADPKVPRYILTERGVGYRLAGNN